jgi:exodeoxyribonuclease VII large subunit
MAEVFSLFELQEHLRRVIALNFSGAVWLDAEIAAHQVSKGHHFLSLVEKAADEGNILAQADAVIWESTFLQLKKQMGRTIEQLLSVGFAVRLKARMDFHERFGLKLIVEAIDINYTIGKLALQREATIQKLRQEERLGKNKLLSLAPVLQRIAVLSSDGAAGWHDFLSHLTSNIYGYQYKIKLFSVAVQGEKVSEEVRRQLLNIRSRLRHFDVVVVIRGGGAKLDLAAFDDLALCRAIADFPLPILTGIGHETDETISDLVAYQRLKTPTAVADFLVQHNCAFELNVAQHLSYIGQMLQRKLQEERLQVERLAQQLNFNVQQKMQQQHFVLQQLAQLMPRLLQQTIQQQKQQLQHLEQIYELLSVEATLKRGFALVKQGATTIGNAQSVNKNQMLEIMFQDGIIQTQVL